MIAGTIQGNFVYLCTCAPVLNILLFHGSVVKKLFFTLWIYCASGIVFCSVFPLFHAWAVAEGLGHCPEAVLDMIGIAIHLVQYLMMEILQRRLHLLKRDFADQDAFYLMYMIVFIYVALSMLLNMFTSVSGWTRDAVLRANYFLNPAELVFDTNCEIIPQYPHIFNDPENFLRIPESIRESANKIMLFDGAIKRAKQMINANYKTAVPQYYKGKIQLLIPICLINENIPDLALVVSMNEARNQYLGHTCLTLDMAYNNARLIARPDSIWLKP